MRRLLFLSVLIVACAPDAKSPLAPSFSTTADPTVSGAVLGPDGVSNICSSLPASAVVRVQAINLATQGFGAPTQFLACPSNAYTFNLLSSDYLIRTVLQASPAIGSLPVRTVNEIPLDTSNVSHDIVINNGTALGGTASIDGAPLENVDLTLVYGQAPGFLVTFGASDASGHWSEGFRPSLILQNNVSYQTSGGCGALGVLAQQGAPAGSFVFPTDVSAINCTFTAAP